MEIINLCKRLFVKVKDIRVLLEDMAYDGWQIYPFFRDIVGIRDELYIDDFLQCGIMEPQIAKVIADYFNKPTGYYFYFDKEEYLRESRRFDKTHVQPPGNRYQRHDLVFETEE